MKETIEFISKYHGQDISSTIHEVRDQKLLSVVARRLMLTNFKGWCQNGDKLVYGEDELVVPTSDWTLLEDGTIRRLDGKRLDSEWLYSISTLLEQDVAANPEAMAKPETATKPTTKPEATTKPETATKPTPTAKPETTKPEEKAKKPEANSGDDRTKDAKTIGSNFSRAGSILNTLDDNKVMNYLEDAVRSEHNNEESTKQRTAWEHSGVNWRFDGVELKGGDVVLYIKVVYSVDGTQSGVKEKTLTIRVQPTPESSIS